MARVSVEESWWSDPRRIKLVLKIGFYADAAALNMWRLAQEFWKTKQGLIPLDIFNTLEHPQALIDVGLAEVRESFVYVRGSSRWLDWVREKKEQASEAGKKSAEARKNKNGTAQPAGGKQDKKKQEKIEPESNENRTDGDGIEPSDSDSVSGSSCNNVLELKVGSETPPPEPPPRPEPDQPESFDLQEKMNAEEELDFTSAFGSKGSCKVIDQLKGYTHLEWALSWVSTQTQRRWVHSYTDTFELRKSLAKGVEHISKRLNERDRSTPTKWSSWLDGWLKGEKNLKKGIPGDNSIALSTAHITEESIFGKAEGAK